MAAGTTAGFSTLPKALMGYMVPSMVPLMVSLALVGESVQLGMAGLLLVYTAALVWMSQFNYATCVSGVRSRIRIAELACQFGNRAPSSTMRSAVFRMASCCSTPTTRL